MMCSRSFLGPVALILPVISTLVLLSPPPSAQTAGQPCDSGPCVMGQWSGPYQLGTSCGSPGVDCPGCPDNQDEVAHAALIPVGSWDGTSLAGKVLYWSACDIQAAQRGVPYTSHIWDPSDPTETPFHPPVNEKLSSHLGFDGNPLGEDGPFCAGHAWILDENGQPKLIVAGGNDRAPFQNPNCIQPCGLNKVYWFDPLAAGEAQAWSDDPPDLPATDQRWYPTIVPFLPSPSATAFELLIVGGGKHSSRRCVLNGQLSQHPGWYSKVRGGMGTWTARGASSSYLWQYYPRILQLTTGDLLSAGHAIVCEQFLPGWNALVPPAGEYGGNPMNRIQLPGHTHAPGPDPNTQSSPIPVGGLDYCNTVVLHTLIDRTAYDPIDPLSNYDLDRILVTGGNYEVRATDGTVNDGVPNPYTLEYVAGEWRQKEPSPTQRVYGNWIPLPDGSLLYEGGLSQQRAIQDLTTFFSNAETFDSQGPLDLGIWHPVAERPSVVPLDAPDRAAPRGYHHVGVLLQDGAVAVLGGSETDLFPWREYASSSSVEVYKPHYFFRGGRLKLTIVPTEMHYAQEVCIGVDKPNKVDWACLIGIGSMTHFSDTGARYIELMTEPCSEGGNIKVLPPSALMAPEGYYFLFVVEDRSGIRVPSKGTFVKLTF